MSSPIVVIVHTKASSMSARAEMLEDINVVVESARNNQPEALKYAVCLPENSTDTSIYIFQEYANKAAYDHYMNSDAFLNCDALRNPQSTTRPLYTVTWSQSALLSRPDRLPSSALKTTQWDLRNRIEHPYVLFATITDSNPKHIEELEPYGAAIVDFATKNEPDTIFYADARPLDLDTGQVTDSLTGEKDGFICAWEVYASKEACDAHLQDESVRNLAVQGHKLGSRFELVPMVMKEGWLVRE